MYEMLSGKVWMLKPQMTLNQTEEHRWLRASSIFQFFKREAGADLVHSETWHLEETEARPD